MPSPMPWVEKVREYVAASLALPDLILVPSEILAHAIPSEHKGKVRICPSLPEPCWQDERSSSWRAAMWELIA